MRRHNQFIAWCLEQPWALMPERVAASAQTLARKVHGDTSAEPQAGRLPARGSGIMAFPAVVSRMLKTQASYANTPRLARAMRELAIQGRA